MIPAASVARRLRRHWALAAVCALFALVAAFTLEDYGAWVDDPSQRAIGNAALDYLAGAREHAYDQLLVSHDRYYGAVAEAPLVLVERLLGLDTPRDIHLSRRALTHLFFLAGGVFCYLLVLRVSGSRALALIATALFLLHPRIYAHSFFNSKDIPFLAAFMIALYLTHRAFRRDTLAAFLLCGAGVGLLVNLRIMGLLIFVAVLVLRGLDLAFAGGADERKRVLLTGAGFALGTILTYHASLPVLWTDPLGRFPDLFSTLGAHPSLTLNLFRGEWLYSTDGPPFDYVPIWVGITTPPAVLLLALAGAVALAWRAAQRPRDALRNGPPRFGLLLIALPAVMAVAVVVLENNTYYDWRHLYFLYAPLLLLAAHGLREMATASWGRWWRAGAYALAGTAIAVTVVSMVRIHPYEINHFTFLTDRTSEDQPGIRYGMNPWNQTLRQTLADIMDDHPSGDLFLSASSRFASFQIRALARDDRDRLSVTRDFRSGERNFLELHNRQPCPAILYRARVYATTLHCVVDPVAWASALRREAMASEPLVRSVYDIHRDGLTLTYLRAGCPLDDVAGELGGTRFFLHVHPLHADDLPPWQRRRGLDFDNLDHVLRHGSARIDGDCVASVRLPDYPIASIRTGQFSNEGVHWEARFSPDGRLAVPPTASELARARETALAGEPLARAVFDVYRAGGALTYLRDGCTEAEAAARFFLHVEPVEARDLPAHRREYGFANLDFNLGANGARIEGDCVAVMPLPDYPIASVRTGQYDATGELWAVAFTLPQ